MLVILMGEMVCANLQCGKLFLKKVHNAKYCSPECRREVTNDRVLKKYYDDKASAEARKTSSRTCTKEDCSRTLSRYNSDDMCEQHKSEDLHQRLKGWGWSKEQIKNFDFL